MYLVIMSMYMTETVSLFILHYQQCSKLTSVRQPMADNSSSRLITFEEITFISALIADKVLDINIKI